MDWWQAAQTVLGFVFAGVAWPWLRKTGRAARAAEIAQRAQDLVALFLRSGMPAQGAIERAASVLQAQGVSSSVAQRAATGAAARFVGARDGVALALALLLSAGGALAQQCGSVGFSGAIGQITLPVGQTFPVTVDVPVTVSENATSGGYCFVKGMLEFNNAGVSSVTVLVGPACPVGWQVFENADPSGVSPTCGGNDLHAWFVHASAGGLNLDAPTPKHAATLRVVVSYLAPGGTIPLMWDCYCGPGVAHHEFLVYSGTGCSSLCDWAVNKCDPDLALTDGWIKRATGGGGGGGELEAVKPCAPGVPCRSTWSAAKRIYR